MTQIRLSGKYCLFLLLVCIQSLLRAENPIVQTNYTADPAPMVHNGTVYLYTTHDEDSTIHNFFTMNDWRCYSSKDMVNWTDHGAILAYSDFTWSRGDAWAGQCIYRNGKFYFYVPVNMKNGGNAIGVAVSDSPTGPFKDAIGAPLLTGYGYIDPSVYIDDDGQPYLYWGNPQLWYVKLNNDMLSFSGKVETVPLTKEGFSTRLKDTDKRPSSYEEGPWFFKRNSKYYLLYPAGGVPEHLAYSTSSNATGPWVYGDTIMPVIGKGGAFTNHPGYIEFKGKSYLFYHTGALPGGGGFKRSVCIEPFRFNADGSIPRIKPTTTGVTESADYLNPYARTEAETIAWEEGVECAKSSTGIYVTHIHNIDFIKVKCVNFDHSTSAFEASVMPTAIAGEIEIHIDDLNQAPLGTLKVPAATNTGEWKKLQCTIKPIKGVHDIYFVFKGNPGTLFNFDWWKFI